MLLDVNEVAGGLVPMLGRLIGTDIEIAMLAGAGLPPVLADRAQLEQVVINLAINARDAMPDGGTLAIETSTTASTCGSPSAIPAPGSSPTTLERIFEPFYTTKEIGLGTGPGARDRARIVTQSGGRSTSAREPGLGSTFTVLLPAAPRARRQPVEHHARPTLGGDETLLLCEDEDAVRPLIELVLRGAGYTVLRPPDAGRGAGARRPPRGESTRS